MVLYATLKMSIFTMLRLSKLADYATVIMSYLAEYPDEITSATSIAKEVHLSVHTVSKILKILLDANLIRAFRGAEGGYQLAKSPEKITLAEVISAIEGNFALTECSLKSKLCSLDTKCSMKKNWKSINQIIFKTLNNVTLKDMLEGV